MAKRAILVEVDYHDATKALSRLLRILEWAGEGYGVYSMEITVFEDEDMQTTKHVENPRWWHRWVGRN